MVRDLFLALVSRVAVGVLGRGEDSGLGVGAVLVAVLCLLIALEVTRGIIGRVAVRVLGGGQNVIVGALIVLLGELATILIGVALEEARDLSDQAVRVDAIVLPGLVVQYTGYLLEK